MLRVWYVRPVTLTKDYWASGLTSGTDEQIGSVIIILHAPADPEVNSVDEILNYATQPGRLRPRL